MSESDQQAQQIAAYNYAYTYGIYGSANGQQHNYLGYQQQGATATPTIQQIGTAAQAYANSQYSLAASAYAQYSQAAQQHANAAAAYGVQQSTDYSSAGAYGVIGTGKPQTTSRKSAASGSNAVTPQQHYAGYQQAVYAAANYAAATQPQATGKQAGQGRQGGRFQKKRYGLGHQNRDMQQYFCEICKVSCAGQVAYKDHMDGKPHKRREQASKSASAPVTGRGQIAFRCEICEITCSSKDTYDAHVKGQKHQRTVALLRRMGKPVPEIPTYDNIPDSNAMDVQQQQQQGRPIPTVGSSVGGPLKKVVGVTGTKFIGGTTLLTTGEELKSAASNGASANMVSITGTVRPQDLEKALLGDENIKPIGQEFIEEEKDANGKFLTYNCKLCDCKFSDIGAKDVHLKGRRHRLNYKQKVDPSLKVEMKPNWGKKGAGPGQQNPIGAYIPPGPPVIYQQPRPHFPMQRTQEIMDDKHVLHKLQQIQVPADEGQKVERLALFVEKTLKAVSDAMVANGGWTGDQAEQNRVLKGVMRVGVLAKHLMIKSDNQIELVVLCSKVPTVSLLKEVVELFEKNAELKEDEKLTVTNVADQSAFTVSVEGAEFPKMVSHITLTAVIMRDGNQQQNQSMQQSADGKEEPASDPLPREPCLKALAELRRTKFYQMKCYPLHSLHCTVKLVRDICLRVRTWAPLNNWIIELLCEKALSSIAMPLSPGDAIRRLFEVISSGVYLNKRSKLIDPCEKEQIDVLANITDQEREDITSSAQHALRLISFDQIYKILGIERLVSQPIPVPLNAVGAQGGGGGPPKPPMKRRADGSSAGGNDDGPINTTTISTQSTIEDQDDTTKGTQNHPPAEDPSTVPPGGLDHDADAPEAKKGKIDDDVKMEEVKNENQSQ